MIRITGQSRGTRLGSRLESASRMRRWCSRKRTSSAPQPLTHSPIPSQQCTYRLRRLFAVCLHFVTLVYLTHGASPSIMAVPSASGRACSTEIAHECTDGKNGNQCLREHGWAHRGRAGTVCLIARPGRLAPPPELGERCTQAGGRTTWVPGTGPLLFGFCQKSIAVIASDSSFE